MHANEYMPAITVAGGQENERRRINGDISSVLGVIRQLAIANTNLTWVSASYGWMVLVIPILVAAPAYFAGGLSLGQLMMAVGAFNQVNTALRWYVANFGPIAEWRATLMRVTDFRQALVDMDISRDLPNTIAMEHSSDDTLTLKDLEISTKTTEDIVENGFRIRDGTVTVKAGEHIMVNGDHGVNRKLLFQALAGQWRCGTGEIDLPPMEQILFMPHTAYVPGGTLREAVTFPEDRDVYSDADVETAIEKAGLDRLKGKLDTRARWDRMLDTDEQKAVAFAHALLAKPRWLILDETLEGLEPDIQERFAGLLAELKDTTTIYIGRSEAYLQALSPRVIHLQALSTPPGPVSAAASPTVATNPAATGAANAKTLSEAFPGASAIARRR
jgi:putative ATP-binding cassette transporter